MKPRHHLYLDDDLTAELERLSSVPGTSKSAIVADALRRHFKYQGNGEHDAAIRLRLDRLSRAHERLARDVEVILESLTVYVKYDFMLTAHLPEPDRVALAKGTERFERYATTVARGIAKAEPMDAQPSSASGDDSARRIGGQ